MSLLSLIPILGSIIDKVIPDRNSAAKAKAELEAMESSGELDLMKSQLLVNSEEAKHTSVFVAGWRPAIGWTCASIYMYHYLIYPLLVLILNVNGVDTKSLPHFDLDAIWPVLGGMLGLGGMRTYEKRHGVTK